MLVVGVLLMTGPPAWTAVGPGDPMSNMVAMAGMAATESTTVGAALLVPGAPSSDGVVVTACALCVDLLESCLAVLGLVVAAALAGPGSSLVRARPRSRRSVRAGRWAVGESPPWSVPSLSQLSVLRV